jgi:hypothetical protein
MKDFFTTWIIWQLIVIAIFVPLEHNAIIDKTYDCSLRNKKISSVKIVLGIMFPLITLYPDSQEIINYCK